MAVELHQVGTGDAALEATIARMWTMIVRHSPRVRAVAESIIRAVPGPCQDFARAAALYQWAQAHLLYVPDHLVVEEVRDADYLLGEIERAGVAMEDCDGYAVLMGALFVSIGLPVAIVRVQPVDEVGGQEHVYLRVWTSCGVMGADGIHGEPFGFELEPDQVVSERVYPLPGWAPEVAGMR